MVRKGDQKEGKLQVINASRLLMDYTYDRVRDQNIFPKSQRWLLAKNVWDYAFGARRNIVHANSIRVESKSDAEERLLSEKKALADIEGLEVLIDLMYLKGLISEDRASYWVGLCREVVKPLNGLLKTDRERYKNI